jgi:hypothetical protein
MKQDGFDTAVMPSSGPARHKERRMLGGIPLYLLIAVPLVAAIFGVILLAIGAR